MNTENLFSSSRHVTDISDCYFYHVMNLPGYGEVGGEWDLRGGEESYLGGVSFQGKRVLELGTASGFLCRFMESKGADVIGFDLPDDRFWDIVPFAGLDLSATKLGMRSHIERLKNGWWFTHQLLGSRAQVVYGNIYDIPAEIGPVDIATFGSILLHLRDPFQALYSALRLTRETAIVTEIHPEQAADDPASTELVSTEASSALGRLVRGLRRSVGFRRHFKRLGNQTETPVVVQRPAYMTFLPRGDDMGAECTGWWSFPPEVICRFLDVLGFEDQVVTEHFQKYQGKRVRLYTVVAKRTVGKVEPARK